MPLFKQLAAKAKMPPPGSPGSLVRQHKGCVCVPLSVWLLPTGSPESLVFSAHVDSSSGPFLLSRNSQVLVCLDNVSSLAESTACAIRHAVELCAWRLAQIMNATSVWIAMMKEVFLSSLEYQDCKRHGFQAAGTARFRRQLEWSSFCGTSEF